MHHLAVALIGLIVMATGQAQSIDTGPARATVGQPLQLTLRVQTFEASPGGLGRDCVRAEVRQGPDTAAHQPLTWARTARAIDGASWVTLSDPQPVREPLLHVRVALLCGAPYTREFTLLADAPDGSKPASVVATSAPVVPTAQRARRTEQSPAIAAAAVPTPKPTNPIPPPAARPSAATLGDDARSRVTFDRPLPTAGGPSDSASPLSDAFLQLWHQDMRALHDEQRQSRALLASLTARLERAEREAGQLAFVAAAAVLGLLGLSVGARLWRDRRQLRPRGAGPASRGPGRQPHRDAEADVPLASSAAVPRREPHLDPTSPLAADPAENRPHTTPGATSPSGAPSTTEDLAAAFNADGAMPSYRPCIGYSQAALDESRHAELLDQVDRMAAEGYLGASVAVLENALQGRVGKSPGILLRLLDHYGALQQPWNRDRVGIELTAIYNVELPGAAIDDGDIAADEGPSIDTIDPTWSTIEGSWATPQASTVLAGVLVKPSLHSPLPLAAFRDALWLHTLSTEREPASPPLTALVSAPVLDLPMTGHAAMAGVIPATSDAPLPDLSWALEPVEP